MLKHIQTVRMHVVEAKMLIYFVPQKNNWIWIIMSIELKLAVGQECKLIAVETMRIWMRTYLNDSAKRNAVHKIVSERDQAQICENLSHNALLWLIIIRVRFMWLIFLWKEKEERRTPLTSAVSEFHWPMNQLFVAHTACAEWSEWNVLAQLCIQFFNSSFIHSAIYCSGRPLFFIAPI